MKRRIKLDIPIIVEGKYDKIRLSNIFDTEIITTEGFGIFKNTEKAESLGVTERLVELLQQDLESKNKQIDDLNNRLAEAMKALDQEQQLKALAERRILELEDKAAAAQETVAEVKETKKGFFSWFSKK